MVRDGARDSKEAQPRRQAFSELRNPPFEPGWGGGIGVRPACTKFFFKILGKKARLAPGPEGRSKGLRGGLLNSAVATFYFDAIEVGTLVYYE